ncbi:MAG: hypothetical protein ABSH20_00420 [Tepidisphaeraceae bacterium]
MELEFEAKGALKEFRRVDLEIKEGEKLLVRSSLREEESKPGHVVVPGHIVVSFAADRVHLDNSTLWVVVGVRAGSVYEIPVKDFVDLEKINEKAKAATRAAPRLQFRLVADADDAAPADTLADSGSKEQLRVRREVLLDESAVSSATVAKAPADGGAQIEVVFTEAGAKRFAEITGADIGKQLAMVFDGKLLSAPTIRSVIHDKAVITGKFTDAEAKAIAETLNDRAKAGATMDK